MELDRLSRKAAGNYDVPGEANWQKMQEELDRVLPVQVQRRTPFYWWLLPALLLGGMAWWLINKNEQPLAPKEAAVSAQVSPEPTVAKAPAAEETGKSGEPDAVAKQPNPVAKTENNGSLNSSPARSTGNARNLSLQKKSVGPTLQDPTVIDPVPQANPSIPATSLTSIEKVSGNVPGENKHNAVADIPAKNNAPVKNEIAVTENTERTETRTAQEPPAARAPSKTTPISANKGKGFSLALLTGVDKSTVKFRYGNGPGFNIGVLAGYHFNDRLSVHTGAIYTQKNYKLAGEDFTAPKGSWVSYYKLENVTGYCRMWEVPLLLRYNVSNPGKNNVYLSTGLSSYFMTKEDYNYFYYSMGQPITRNTSYASTDTHLLSVAHVSAGFETPLTRSLSLQVEPYAKIPLGNVGLGNIRLSSFGVNFSVQYRQPAKK